MRTHSVGPLLGVHELDEAASLLRRGGLVAFPTETVYGLGADARNPDAIRRLFAAKGRPADNPLIVHVADITDVPGIVREITPLARTLAARWWPGPLTLVLDADPNLPRITTGGHPTVGVRVPDHPVARRLLELAGVPVAAPSANRSGRPSPTTAEHVLADLGDAVDAIVDGGPCVVGLESTVVDARGDVPVVLREGAVTREHLAAADDAPTPDRAASPGTRYRHYAPTCRVEIAEPADVAQRCATLATQGLRVAALLPSDVPSPAGAVLVVRADDAAETATRLYATFHDAEASGADVLVVAAVLEEGLGRAVMDRLRRAST